MKQVQYNDYLFTVYWWPGALVLQQQGIINYSAEYAPPCITPSHTYTKLVNMWNDQDI